MFRIAIFIFSGEITVDVLKRFWQMVVFKTRITHSEIDLKLRHYFIERIISSFYKSCTNKIATRFNALQVVLINARQQRKKITEARFLHSESEIRLIAAIEESDKSIEAEFKVTELK